MVSRHFHNQSGAFAGRGPFYEIEVFMRNLSAVPGPAIVRRLRQGTFVALLAVASSIPAWGAACKVTPAHPPSEAELVFLKGDHAKAATMLQADLAKTPNDPDKTALLVRALLWQGKTAEASDVITKALGAHADSPTLLTEKAEVLFRQGRPWDVGNALAAALKVDQCFPRAFILYAWLSNAQSNHAVAHKAVQTAHQLDPNDLEIWQYWLNTLTLKQRIAAIDAGPPSGPTEDEKEKKQRQNHIDYLKKLADEPPKPCRLVSNSASADLPLQSIIRQGRGGGLATSAWALNVGINGHESLLQVDTGASGLLVSKAVADHADLRSSGAEPIVGFGDEGPQHGFRAYADSIRIGSLEFKDCAVRVFEKGMGGSDGLIGADVFSRFLVTIDYPVHKIKLDPLPLPPNHAEIETPSLSTTEVDSADLQAAASSSDAAGAAPRLTDRYIAPEMKDWVPIYHVGHNLIVPASLRPPDVRLFLVDTGAWSTIVAPEAAREVTKVDLNNGMQMGGLNGAVNKNYVAEVLDIKFGGISKHELGVPSMSMDMESMYSAMNISGLLGADILEQLTIHIDYRDGLMKFEYDPKRGYHPLNH